MSDAPKNEGAGAARRPVPPDSRLWLLAALLERRMPIYFPPGHVPAGKAARRVVLAVAAEVLPDTDLSAPLEAETVRLIQRLIACPPL